MVAWWRRRTPAIRRQHAPARHRGLGGTLITPAILNDGAIVANFTDGVTLANISGTGTLSKAGAGTLTLSGVNSYAGGTIITGGMINFNAANNFGSGMITIDGGGLQWASGTTADISAQLAAFGGGGAAFDTNGNNVTFASALSGVGGLTKAGAGTLTLSGNNTYQAARRSMAAPSPSPRTPSGAATGDLLLHRRHADSWRASTTHRAVTWQASARSTPTATIATFAGTISGSGGLTKVGGGTFTLSGTSSLFRRDGGQCRHAAGRGDECLRAVQRVHGRGRRHARSRGLQPDHRLARGRRQRDAGRGRR